MPERLAGFAARHRTALRRGLWLVGGAGAGAAAVAAGPRLAEALPAPQERRERLDKYAQQLRDYRERTMARASAAGRSAAVLARTTKAAAAASWRSDTVTLGEAVADAIAALGADEDKETVVIFGGPLLLDGLLDAAAISSRSPRERAAAERALASLLATGTTASAVLSRPGAVPRLLAAAGHHACDALPGALRAGATMARLPPALPFDDLSALLAQAGDAGDRGVQLLAVQLLGLTAEASVMNCGKLAALGAGGALAALSDAALERPADRQLRWDLIRAMAVLARDSPLKGPLQLGDWLQRLLYFAADAAAAGDRPLASRALDGFSAAAEAGGMRIAAALRQCNALPLAAQLWRNADAQLQRSLMTAVSAVASAGEECMPEGQRDAWTERLLAFVLRDDTPPPLRAAAGDTLGDLAAAEGPEGTAVAVAWLGEVLIALSRSVTAYYVVRSLPTQPQPPPPAALPASSSRWRWLPWGYGDSGAADSGAIRTESANDGGSEGSSGAQGSNGTKQGTEGQQGAGRQADAEAEAALLRAVGVVPSFARAVAAELRSATDRAAAGFADPPADAETFAFTGPAALATFPAAADAEDPVAAEALLSQALAVLCNMVSADVERQAWLHQAGALRMLHRLTLARAAQRRRASSDMSGASSDGSGGTNGTGISLDDSGSQGDGSSAEGADADAAAAEAVSPGLRQQTVRLLALLSTDAAAEPALRSGPWLRFLREAAASDDCTLASDAGRALLNMRSAAAAAAATSAPAPAAKPSEVAADIVPPTLPPHPRCVLREGLHLFSPQAPHHAALADQGADATGPGAPEVDIVFVHGIRGGAFATWRQLDAPSPAAAKAGDAAAAAAAAGAPPMVSPAAVGAAADGSSTGNGLGAGGSSAGSTAPDEMGDDQQQDNDGQQEAAASSVGSGGGREQQQHQRQSNVAEGKGVESAVNGGFHSADGGTNGNTASNGDSSEDSASPPQPDAAQAAAITRAAAATVSAVKSAASLAIPVVTPRPTLPEDEAAADADMSRGDCWPAAWLQRDLPGARLLTVEYAAPASNWEGESLPMRGTIVQLQERLVAAGVGYRPVIFVCHSLGGVLAKELLARGLDAEPDSVAGRIAAATTGLVTYSTPHAGSWLADWGWRLRYLGAAPDPVVSHLKPGAHLEGTNAALKARAEAGRLATLSFAEGVPSRVTALLPRLIVVPPESAYPGVGEFVPLGDLDHIQACKPPDRQHPAYARLREFLLREVQRTRAEHEHAGQAEA